VAILARRDTNCAEMLRLVRDGQMTTSSTRVSEHVFEWIIAIGTTGAQSRAPNHLASLE